jgi:uncharacterized membrane protein YfcA
MTTTMILAVLSGTVMGFLLGLLGGGGSILGTPMLVYIVGIADTHVAIGTAAMAVSTNAFINLLAHARTSKIWWRSASVFAAVGAIGVVSGSRVAKAVHGQVLLFLFGFLMIAVGYLMLRGRARGTNANAVEPKPGAKLAGVALAVGFAAGFFGVGGGFMIVPGLVWAAEMPIMIAIGSALLSVCVFATGTLITYASAGLVNWEIGAEVIAGGIIGGLIGVSVAGRLAARRHTLSRVFAVTILACSVYVLYRSARVFF